MPRSVVVLSSDPDLFDNVRALLATDPRFVDAGNTVHCDGSLAPLTNIYPVETHPVEWDDWDAATSGMPDPRTSSLLIFESRSHEWVAEVGRVLAEGLTSPVWIVDSADTVWPADQIDSARVALA
ncbi:hypothetical protein ASE01_18600 [Nocardioides sp. Root190]|uniref:hypothetical protein n=1 Tax=Nocardioides sp. Root190 TaxID=1736488 RepID=UPI0006F49D45|nr:hypothetical protein [Nocardioides sp. Root190]KRB74006.1 hypothetical protein ASE01_18600 [Nocardioides sp. Root190]